jgi:hypothetical protein
MKSDIFPGDSNGETGCQGVQLGERMPHHSCTLRKVTWWQKFFNFTISFARLLCNVGFETLAFRVSKRRGARGQSGLVSIPIATFDRIETVVSRTVPALLGQSYQDIEIIIVADGTPADGLHRLRSVESDKIRVIPLMRRSKYPGDPLDMWFVAGSRPRNIGAKLAKGEFILWTSDDDLLAPHSLEVLVQFLREHPEVDAVGGASQLGEDPQTLNRASTSSREIGFGTGAMPAWLHRRTLRVFKWSTQSWRKKWNRPADYDLAERMRRAGARFEAIDDLVVVKPLSPTGLHGSENFISEELSRRTSFSNEEGC